MNIKTTDNAISKHYNLLGHQGYGVTELRVFKPQPRVAYVDNSVDFIQLVAAMDGKVPGIYAGVQPRPAHLFDLAANQWVLARGGLNGNCAVDDDIEYITTCFWDIDVVSPQRAGGHPASEQELKTSFQAAQRIAGQEESKDCACICCSGNGHYVLAPILPIEVDTPQVGRQFKIFCSQIAGRVHIQGVRIDPVYDSVRVMRVLGTTNKKGTPLPDRRHRMAGFVTVPAGKRSVELHHIIKNIDVQPTSRISQTLCTGVICDLDKLEQCQFIRWCRKYPRRVTEPLWFGLICNISRLEGGPELIHEISALDSVRYDYKRTQRMIERVIARGYRPVKCKSLVHYRPEHTADRFDCTRIHTCHADAPMYFGTVSKISIL